MFPIMSLPSKNLSTLKDKTFPFGGRNSIRKYLVTRVLTRIMALLEVGGYRGPVIEMSLTGIGGECRRWEEIVKD